VVGKQQNTQVLVYLPVTYVPMLLVAWRGLLLYSAPAVLPFCCWLVGRVCRRGQENDYGLLGGGLFSV
jgi:hypothetical protein